MLDGGGESGVEDGVELRLVLGSSTGGMHVIISLLAGRLRGGLLGALKAAFCSWPLVVGRPDFVGEGLNLVRRYIFPKNPGQDVSRRSSSTLISIHI